SEGTSDLGFDLPPPARLGSAKTAVAVTLGVAVVAGAFLVGWLPKRKARLELEAATTADTAGVLRVETLTPKVLSSDRALVLPGTVSPLEEAVIRTRANGYVRQRLADIG